LHGLVEAQALDVGPREGAASLSRHLGGIEQGRELDEPGTRRGLYARYEVPQREAVPRNDHGPALDAAVPVRPLFDGLSLEDVVQVVVTRLGDFAGDLDLPGARLEAPGVLRRILLAGAELVVVVVVGDALVRGRLVVVAAPPRAGAADGGRGEVEGGETTRPPRTSGGQGRGSRA